METQSTETTETDRSSAPARREFLNETAQVKEATEYKARLLTRHDLANRAGVCVATVTRWTRRGLVPVIRINARVVRYRLEDVEKFLTATTGGLN